MEPKLTVHARPACKGQEYDCTVALNVESVH